MRRIVPSLLFAALLQVAVGQDALIKAAAKYVPGVTWQVRSEVTVDFTCQGHAQTAIWGTDKDGIAVAVFVGGANRRPEVFHGVPRHVTYFKLTAEDMDYDPKEDPGWSPRFQAFKNMQGVASGRRGNRRRALLLEPRCSQV
jgi:hypothetical protein